MTSFDDLSDDMKTRFLELACKLSPEALSGDGEIPRHEVERRYQKLTKKWSELEARAQTKVDVDLVWGWHAKSKPNSSLTNPARTAGY